MALLDEKNLAGEAGEAAAVPVHHVGTKLNEAEVRELDALATKRSQTQAELIREIVVRRNRNFAEMPLLV